MPSPIGAKLRGAMIPGGHAAHGGRRSKRKSKRKQMALGASGRGSVKAKGGSRKGGKGMHGDARAVTAMGTVRHTGGHSGGVGVSMSGKGGRASKRGSRKGGR